MFLLYLHIDTNGFQIFLFREWLFFLPCLY